MSTPVYANGRWDERSLREWVPAVVDDIVTKYDPAKIILFGSVAEGQEGPDSDLDLLVVLDEVDPADRARLMGEIRFSINAPIAIDIFVTDLEECDRRKDVIGSMHYVPLREGEVVYERAS